MVTPIRQVSALRKAKKHVLAENPYTKKKPKFPIGRRYRENRENRYFRGDRSSEMWVMTRDFHF